MEKELRIEVEGGEMTPVKALAALVKLQQITSGFIVKPNQAGTLYIPDGNPRLKALLDVIERIPGKLIVWARFHEELDCVAAELRAAGRRVVEYHGRVSEREREAAVDGFQNGNADVFVGQGQSGGVGLTLTAAEHAIYYSNDFNLRTRLQSEDRCHRIGTKSSVVYIDLVAEDTVDEAISRSLQRKAVLAATILGDRGIDLRGMI
jgi:SNF2 family DNA or RNA helicase